MRRGHAARLGSPTFVFPPELHLYARAAASLGLGGVVVALLGCQIDPYDVQPVVERGGPARSGKRCE